VLIGLPLTDRSDSRVGWIHETSLVCHPTALAVRGHRGRPGHLNGPSEARTAHKMLKSRE